MDTFPSERTAVVSGAGSQRGARRREGQDEQAFEEMQFRAYTGAGVDGTVAAHD